MKVLHVVGARPNFMKIAPIKEEMSRYPSEFEQILLHTGQHYDRRMSQEIFEDLGLPRPDVDLGVGSGSHAQQTSQIISRFEPVVQEHRPDWVIVVGDVNSTLACAIVCCKLNIKVAHVESGLRSFDRTMPEEFNRLLTDQIADLLFTPSQDAGENLLREGISKDKVRFVGNVMIDTLVKCLPKAAQRWASLKERLGLDGGDFILSTLHRPSNVDNPATLAEIIDAMNRLSSDIPVVFPVHPRTRQRLNGGVKDKTGGRLILTEPLGYLDFLALEKHARLVLTDSGGVQEETTYLGVPCLTVRPNTERPVTITSGTNRLVGGSRTAILDAARGSLKQSRSREKDPPPLWDGRAAKRIVEIMRSLG